MTSAGNLSPLSPEGNKKRVILSQHLLRRHLLSKCDVRVWNERNLFSVIDRMVFLSQYLHETPGMLQAQIIHTHGPHHRNLQGQHVHTLIIVPSPHCRVMCVKSALGLAASANIDTDTFVPLACHSEHLNAQSSSNTARAGLREHFNTRMHAAWHQR